VAPDFDASHPDDERHFVEHVGRAAVFEHAHLAHGHAIKNALAHQNHAIRHERHEAVVMRVR
jgi:hypothetical protein